MPLTYKEIERSIADAAFGTNDLGKYAFFTHDEKGNFTAEKLEDILVTTTPVYLERAVFSKAQLASRCGLPLMRIDALLFAILLARRGKPPGISAMEHALEETNTASTQTMYAQSIVKATNPLEHIVLALPKRGYIPKYPLSQIILGTAGARKALEHFVKHTEVFSVKYKLTCGYAGQTIYDAEIQFLRTLINTLDGEATCLTGLLSATS